MKKNNILYSNVTFTKIETDDLLKLVDSTIHNGIENGNVEHYIDKYIGLALSLVLYSRTEISFSSAINLIKEGYIIEANCVLRLIFEQLCYSIAISKSDINKIDKISVTKSINSISVINSDYKQLYSLMSSLAHFNIKELYRVLHAEEKSDTSMSIEVTVLEKEGQTSSQNIKLLMIMSVLYNQVGIYLYDLIKNASSQNKIKNMRTNIKTIFNNTVQYNDLNRISLFLILYEIDKYF